MITGKGRTNSKDALLAGNRVGTDTTIIDKMHSLCIQAEQLSIEKLPPRCNLGLQLLPSDGDASVTRLGRVQIRRKERVSNNRFADRRLRFHNSCLSTSSWYVALSNVMRWR